MKLEEFLNSQKYLREASLKKAIIRESKIEKVPEDTLILKEGTYIKMIPVVLDGLIKVSKSIDDKEVLLYHINPQESCIMSILATFKQEKSNFRAITVEDSQILLIPSRLLAEWQIKFPDFNLFVMELYYKRFDDVLHALESIAFQKLDQRLIEYLYKQVQINHSHSLKITHQTIAEDLGTSREVISRYLKNLENQEKILLRRGKIEILDLN